MYFTSSTFDIITSNQILSYMNIDIKRWVEVIPVCEKESVCVWKHVYKTSASCGKKKEKKKQTNTQCI